MLRDPSYVMIITAAVSGALYIYIYELLGNESKPDGQEKASIETLTTGNLTGSEKFNTIKCVLTYDPCALCLVQPKIRVRCGAVDAESPVVLNLGC